MKRSLLQNATLLTRNPIMSHSPNPAAASILRRRLFSSESNSPTPPSETSSNCRRSTTLKRSLLRNATLFPRNLILTRSQYPAAAAALKQRFFSSDSELPPSQEAPAAPSELSSTLAVPSQPSESSSTLAAIQKTDQLKDVSNKELKEMMGKYFKGDEEVLPLIAEAVFRRRLSGKHEDTDDELMEELEMTPLDEVRDEDFESDFEELHETDTEIDNLYNARDYVMKKMADDEYFNMDDKKWDEMVKESVEHGLLRDTKDCEEILEDMLSWDKLLPDDIKKKVEKKFNELGDMCERGELEPEQAYEQFKQFEDEMVLEYGKIMEAEGPPKFDESAVPDKKKNLDDPPGDGPILRWQTRVVFAPGGDAWHPKNRKVKMGVTVKELGLSKHQFRRLRELVGKCYHPGRDELTITSERFEHREENRKDCLRTLFSLIEEAGKANKLIEDARTSYAKDRLRSNPAFMERLRSKIVRQGSGTVAA